MDTDSLYFALSEKTLDACVARDLTENINQSFLIGFQECAVQLIMSKISANLDYSKKNAKDIGDMDFVRNPIAQKQTQIHANLAKE